MSFLTEGMLAAKAVRSSLSGPLEATKSRGLPCPSFLCLSGETSSTIMVGNHPRGLFPITLGCSCLWYVVRLSGGECRGTVWDQAV